MNGAQQFHTGPSIITTATRTTATVVLKAIWRLFAASLRRKAGQNSKDS